MPIQNINGKLRFEPTAEQTAERTEHIDARSAYDILEARFATMRNADLSQAAWADLEDPAAFSALSAAQQANRLRLAALANRDAILAQRQWNIVVGRTLRFVLRWIFRQRG